MYTLFFNFGSKNFFQVSTESKDTDTRDTKDTPKYNTPDFYYTYYKPIRFDERLWHKSGMPKSRQT